MADMGMAGMAGMDPKQADATAAANGMDMPGMETMPAQSESLPTESLPKSVMHAPGGHGKWSVNTAMMAARRYDEPGIGLGEDGWRVLTYGDLRALCRPADRRAPDREFELHLTGNMERYVWGFDGKTWSEAGGPIEFVYGERVRINLINDTMMEHPLHLHGMWTDLYAGGTLEDNPRKHTVSVKPGELLSVDITADAQAVGPSTVTCSTTWTRACSALLPSSARSATRKGTTPMPNPTLAVAALVALALALPAFAQSRPPRPARRRRCRPTW